MGAASGTPVRVLVVDDDADLLLMLRAAGDRDPRIDVLGATSPEEAMALSREAPPDAILLDHNFPTTGAEGADAVGRAPRGMSGLEAIEYLRSAAPDAVIAIYTGSPGLGESAENAGADLYLVKGPDPAEALAEVAGLARQRSLG